MSSNAEQRPARIYPALLILLILQGVLLAISIPGHPLHIDEAWIGEQTWSYARDGYVHSNLFEGMAQSEERIIPYHRLFVLAGSWMVELFGWGIGPLRVVPIVCGIALLAAMALYMRRDYTREEIVMALVVMLLVPIDFYHFKIYRPEMMMALFGFGSYWLLERHSREHAWWTAAASGVLAAAAALSHLYGLIFILCAGAMLLRMRLWKGLPLFALGALLPFIPYLIEIVSQYDLFHAQITTSVAAKKTSFTFLTPFTNLLEEHKRLFRKPEIILVVLLYIVALIANWKRRYRTHRLLYEYTLLLVLLLGAIAPDKLVTRYAIPLFPFFALEIAAACRGALDGRITSRWIRIPYALLLALFLGYGIYYQITDTFAPREHPAELNGTIGRQIPDGARVVGPMNMIFNEVERLHIVGLYLARKEHGDSLSLAGALRFAEAHNAPYIVINRLATNEEVIDDLTLGKVEPGDGYEVVENAPEYAIIRRK